MRQVIIDHVGCSVPLPDPCKKAEIIEHLEPAFIQMETLIHGKTTGGDVKTVVRGGFLKIEAGQVNSFQPKSKFQTLLVDTGVKAKTSMAVAKVKERVDKGTGTPILVQIGAITEEMSSIVLEQDFETSPAFISKMSTNHELLKDLGLNIPQIDDIVDIFSSFSIPSKISGKGCGGIVIAITADDCSLVAKVRAERESKGYAVYSPILDEEGVTCAVAL